MWSFLAPHGMISSKEDCFRTSSGSRTDSQTDQVCLDKCHLLILGACCWQRKDPAGARDLYSATEIGLAVVHSVDHFSVYLIVTDFNIETDQKALEFRHTAKTVIRRLTWRALRLQPFSYKMYRPGSKNGNADGFFRQAYDLPEATDLPNSRYGLWLP